MSNKKTITAAELKELLAGGPVEFTFKKKDGSLRKAKGTRLGSLIPSDKKPVGLESSPKVLAFFDLEADGWRSLQVDAAIFA